MNAATHTFPLPEPEAHKLEVVTEELRQQPAYEKLNDLVRANVWTSVLAVFAVGLAIGSTLKVLRQR